MSQTFARHRLRSFGMSVLIASLSFLSTGCLCSFKKEWKEAQRCGIATDNLAGLWEGTWESEKNGHHGSLKAIIRKCDDGHYRARYYATFAVLIPYSYDTTHSAVPGECGTHFCGEEDLGCLAGGLYRTNGHANGRTFVARYKADKDYGVFRMCRVQTCGGNCCTTFAAVGEPVPVTTEAVTLETATTPVAPAEAPAAR
jgi:hypothetical protein